MATSLVVNMQNVWICMHVNYYPNHSMCALVRLRMNRCVVTPGARISCDDTFQRIHKCGFGSVQARDVCVVATQALKYPMWAGQMTVWLGETTELQLMTSGTWDVQSILRLLILTLSSEVWRCSYTIVLQIEWIEPGWPSWSSTFPVALGLALWENALSCNSAASSSCYFNWKCSHYCSAENCF